MSGLFQSVRDSKSDGEAPDEAADAKASTSSPGGSLQRDGDDDKAPAPSASASFPASIRDPRSPAGMKDRIAPGVDTAIAVTVSGGPVTITVDGGGGTNGQATLNGAATAPLAASGQVTLRGTTQTAVGSGGNLKLVAKAGAQVVGTSAPFSVSAIPRDYTDTFKSLLKDHRRGFVVQDGWKSDSASGAIADLDGAEISEMVEYQRGTGCFAGAAPGQNSDYLPANRLTTDTHSRGVAELTSPGFLDANQTCKFNDKRSGSTDIPMQNSGYLLSRLVIYSDRAGTKLEITTSKAGQALSAKGVASDVGVGNIRKTQDVATGAEV